MTALSATNTKVQAQRAGNFLKVLREATYKPQHDVCRVYIKDYS
jgi:hypothetical protein